MWIKRLWLWLRRRLGGRPAEKPKDIYPLW
jgi:hypothetical protein